MGLEQVCVFLLDGHVVAVQGLDWFGELCEEV